MADEADLGNVIAVKIVVSRRLVAQAYVELSGNGLSGNLEVLTVQIDK